MHMIICLVLLFLISSATSNYHKLLERHYFVELDETNLNATTEFMDSFHTVVNIHRIISHRFLQAVSIEIKDNLAISLLHQHGNIRSVSPIQIIHRADSTPALQDLTPEQVGLVSPHHLSQVDKVHNELKLTGQGLFIGVIDSGVDYYHPALGGGFGPGFKVIAGYDFVGDNWNSSDPNSIPEPDNDPLDNCGKNSKATGHGTHVSGIIAGFDKKRNFTGVAPGAKLGMWRVFSCAGTARSDVVIDAMLMAFDAGVDIISMSLGSDAPWSAPLNIQAKVVSRISASGVSVVMSAGNNGNQGAFTTSTPGNIVSAFSVASVNNEYASFDGSFIATNALKPIRFNIVQGINLTIPDGYLVLSHKGTVPIKSDACRSGSISDKVRGNIVLVERGGCTFTVKISHLASKGAIGVIIYDNTDEPPLTADVQNVTIPAYTISLQDGLLLGKLLGSEEKVFIKFSISKGPTFFKSNYAKIVSAFSSIGPTAELNLKPNIAAVGQFVYSTLPRYLGGWGIKQGTSMACPYVAGSIALYLEYHGKNNSSRKEVHEKFQNFASVTTINNDKSIHLDSPLSQGAGFIQVYDTILGTAHITPAQISFNDTFTTDYRIQNLTVTNNGLEDIAYRVFNNVTVSLSPYNQSISSYVYVGPVQKSFHYANMEFSTNEISLKPGQSQTISVSIYPPNTNPLDHVMYGGFIQFEAIHHATRDIQVPYFGVVGVQRDLPIFDKERFAVNNNGTQVFYDLKKPIFYNLTLFKTNSFLIHFKLFSPTLVVKGELMVNNTILGYAFPPSTYLQRDYPDNSNVRSPFVWSGKYFEVLPYDILAYSEESIPEIPPELYINIKPGVYSIKMSALKQFGDMNIEQDWETFMIGPFVIK